jgi:hypothetical protein
MHNQECFMSTATLAQTSNFVFGQGRALAGQPGRAPASVIASARAHCRGLFKLLEPTLDCFGPGQSSGHLRVARNLRGLDVGRRVCLQGRGDRVCTRREAAVSHKLGRTELGRGARVGQRLRGVAVAKALPTW